MYHKNVPDGDNSIFLILLPGIWLRTKHQDFQDKTGPRPKQDDDIKTLQITLDKCARRSGFDPQDRTPRATASH